MTLTGSEQGQQCFGTSNVFIQDTRFSIFIIINCNQWINNNRIMMSIERYDSRGWRIVTAFNYVYNLWLFDMNLEYFFGFVIGVMFFSSMAVAQVTGQNDESTTPAINYAQTAQALLNQTMVEYNKGNSTGAEELATKAYLDNFEYVEPALEKKGAGDLMEQIEGMMREELRGMIKDNAATDEVSDHINSTNAKLTDAILILNGTSN